MSALVALPAGLASRLSTLCGFACSPCWTCWLVLALGVVEPCLSLEFVECGLSGLSTGSCGFCCAQAAPPARRAARQMERIEAVMWSSPVKSARKLTTHRPDRTLPALPHLHDGRACD